MNSSIENLFVPPITTALMFKGSVATKEDLSEYEKDMKVGDIILCNEDQCTYVWTGDVLESLGGVNDTNNEDNHYEEVLENSKCINCGAPLKINGHRYDSEITCEYCGSIYHKNKKKENNNG